MESQQEKCLPVTQGTQTQRCCSKWWIFKNDFKHASRLDGPYAFFVCLCGFICVLIPIGCAYSYGLLFPVLLVEFKEGKARTGKLLICSNPRVIIPPQRGGGGGGEGQDGKEANLPSPVSFIPGSRPFFSLPPQFSQLQILSTVVKIFGLSLPLLPFKTPTSRSFVPRLSYPSALYSLVL